ncbi:hypothetical protein C6376_40145 [Streptomyces sp. P3]|nr:hypothetical protein C6376_40145 [Streptomyces sp. P3]
MSPKAPLGTSGAARRDGARDRGGAGARAAGPAPGGASSRRSAHPGGPGPLTPSGPARASIRRR